MSQLVGENLKRLRLKHRPELTQEQLAALSGVSRGTIAVIETGARKNIEIETLQKLAAALGAPVEKLLAS